MKRSEVREFVRLGVAALSGPQVEFYFGKLNDWNAFPNKLYPSVLLETNDSMSVDTELPTNTIPIDNWKIILRICRQDHMDSAPEVYEPMVDQADEIAQQLVYQYNRLISGYKLVTLKGIRRVPFIKGMAADCLTGVTLSFQIDAPDTSAQCQPGDL